MMLVKMINTDFRFSMDKQELVLVFTTHMAPLQISSWPWIERSINSLSQILHLILRGRSKDDYITGNGSDDCFI